MRRKSIIWITLLFVCLGLVFTACSQQEQADHQHQQTLITSTPTLFFHGGGSSYHAEEHMVQAAEKAGVTHSVIRADVTNNGRVTLYGHWQKGARNPICKVNYLNNRQLDFKKHGEYATNVVKKLHQRYGIKKINMVGHSLGNISIIYYMLKNGRNRHMPKLQKQVDMAGHFAGLNFKQVPAAIRQPRGLELNATGKPNKMNETYRQMTAARHAYPQGQVAVLNIIGDIGHHTDGTVPNVSSLSLKYLVANRAKSYRVVKITGKNARHSRLHENPHVDRLLIRFLWNK